MTRLDDIQISREIVARFSAKLLDGLDCDVAIAGGGPAGLTAAYYLARGGKKVAVFERKLAPGGGMWGGGIMFNEIVVQSEGKRLLEEFGVRVVPVAEGYFCADSVEAAATICAMSLKAGARLFNLFSVEDVMMNAGRVTGLVINWSAVETARLHVDPISVRSRYVVDASGHAAEVARIIETKSGGRLNTPTGKIIGERPMCAEVGERMIVENTKEIFPGVFAAGMCCNAIWGGPRMGPIFGGMLLSGEKVAQLLTERLKNEP